MAQLGEGFNILDPDGSLARQFLATPLTKDQIAKVFPPLLPYGSGRNWGTTMQAEAKHARDKFVGTLGMLEPLRVRCGRCGISHDGIAAFQAHTCISDAEVAISLKIQSLFDQQQRRGAAFFMGDV
jgi:hypothetical protein